MNEKTNHTSNALARLQEWARAHCNGKWEGDVGVRIATLEFPGWGLTVALQGTELEGKAQSAQRFERTKDDWYFYVAGKNQFEAAGGMNNLEEMIETFLTWAGEPLNEKRGAQSAE
jgi:hypothetical protein